MSVKKEQLANLRNLLKATIKRESPFYTLESSKKRIALTANLFRKAYRDDQIVVWRSSFLPTELIFGLGLVPFPPESVISMFANSGLGSKVLNIAEDNFHSRDTCSFLRGTYGAVIENCLPEPDFLACTSLYCDGSSKLFYTLAKKYNKPYFHIDVPYHHGYQYALDYVAVQLEEMTKEMAQIKGINLDMDRLHQTIVYSNEAREYFVKINELRQSIPAPMLGGEAINYAIMLAHTWGSKEIVEVYKKLYEELKERVDKKIPAIPGGENHRILWRNLKPYYSDFLMQYLELQNKVVVAFEEVNYIHWQEMNPNQPFKSLAEKMLSNPPLGKFDRWLNETMKVVKDYTVDGVIEFDQWGCRHLNSGTQILKETLGQKEIPLLILDGDCIDSRDYADGQVKTRIDAFLEILYRKHRK